MQQRSLWCFFQLFSSWCYIPWRSKRKIIVCIHSSASFHPKGTHTQFTCLQTKVNIYSTIYTLMFCTVLDLSYFWTLPPFITYIRQTPIQFEPARWSKVLHKITQIKIEYCLQHNKPLSKEKETFTHSDLQSLATLLILKPSVTNAQMLQLTISLKTFCDRGSDLGDANYSSVYTEEEQDSYLPFSTILDNLSIVQKRSYWKWSTQHIHSVIRPILCVVMFGEWAICLWCASIRSMKMVNFFHTFQDSVGTKQMAK